MKADYAEAENQKSLKGIWQRLKKPLLIAFFILVLLVSYTLYAQRSGFFPGDLLNRIPVTARLKEAYGNEAGPFTVRFREYDAVRGRYVYDCSCKKGSFQMAAKNFKVLEDGYYRDYVCDAERSNGAAERLVAFFEENWPSGAVRLVLRADLAVPPDAKETDADALLTAYGKTLQLTAELSGSGALSYEDYTEQVWQVLKLYRERFGTLYPDFVQVFYRYGGTLQYESRLSGYALRYTESGLKRAKNVHYYVELPAEKQADLKWYTRIRAVNFIVIGGCVIGFGTLWIVRYRKKKKRFVKENL